jgi:GNAT superfamily N-acetyltransferase
MVTASLHNLRFITPITFPNYRKIVAPHAEQCWPEFMLHDAIADEHWGALFERFPEFQFGFLDSETGAAAAMGNSVPLSWQRGLDELPDQGWDWAFAQAVEDHRAGIAANIQCAIQIAIHPSYRGQGLSMRMVQAMRSVGLTNGFERLIAPVRPSQKAKYPLACIDRFITWKTDEGWPFDAWLRVHARAGAIILGACHNSMTIRGTVNEWHQWTGLSFPESGEYIVAGALNPIRIDLQADQGVYVEPNVWMVHDLHRESLSAKPPDL